MIFPGFSGVGLIFPGFPGRVGTLRLFIQFSTPPPPGVNIVVNPKLRDQWQVLFFTPHGDGHPVTFPAKKLHLPICPIWTSQVEINHQKCLHVPCPPKDVS